MNLMGCQGKDNSVTLEIRTCPECGEEIELFSIDSQVVCENCGHVVYNDMITCVQWCEYAEMCVGSEIYQQMMAVAAEQRQRKAETAAESPETSEGSSNAVG